jgi:hypothetical protein
MFYVVVLVALLAGLGFSICNFWWVENSYGTDLIEKLHPNFRLASKNGARDVKYWEIIADNLSKAGWSWGIVSAIDSEGRTIWIADAHRDDGKRFVAHAEEKNPPDVSWLSTIDYFLVSLVVALALAAVVD